MNSPEIIAELHRIAKQHDGELRPADVVKAAKKETSPLHSHFQWDDSLAAHQWRLEQARQLIRVTVEYVGPKDAKVMARVFVSLSPDRKNNGGGYRVTEFVMGNSSQRAILLADALADMQRFADKYSALKELEEVFAAIRKFGKNSAAA